MEKDLLLRTLSPLPPARGFWSHPAHRLPGVVRAEERASGSALPNGLSPPSALRPCRLPGTRSGGSVANLLPWPFQQGPDVDLERPIAAGCVAQSSAHGLPFRLGAVARRGARLLLRRRF